MAETPGAARFTAYPVLDEGQVVGMLPFSRLTRIPREDWDRNLVADSMVPITEITVLEPDEPAVAAFADLSRGQLHRGVVLDSGRLVGLVSITDIARLLALRRRQTSPS